MKPLINRTADFTDSVIRRMTRISNQYNAINLSLGFPDFDPPKPILEAWKKLPIRGLINIPLPAERKISGRPWRKNSPD